MRQLRSNVSADANGKTGRSQRFLQASVMTCRRFFSERGVYLCLYGNCVSVWLLETLNFLCFYTATNQGTCFYRRIKLMLHFSSTWGGTWKLRPIRNLLWERKWNTDNNKRGIYIIPLECCLSIISDIGTVTTIHKAFVMALYFVLF